MISKIYEIEETPKKPRKKSMNIRKELWKVRAKRGFINSAQVQKGPRLGWPIFEMSLDNLLSAHSICENIVQVPISFFQNRALNPGFLSYSEKDVIDKYMDYNPALLAT